MAISVISPIIQFRLLLAEQFGANPAQIMEEAGLRPEDLANPESRIPLEKERQVWCTIVKQTGREDIGLICGQNLPIRVASVIGYVMMNAPTIAVAIQKMCAYQRLVGNSMGMAHTIDRNHYYVKVLMWTDWVEELRFTMDVMMAAIISWTENNTIQKIRPFEAGFSYQKPKNYKDYEKMFEPAPVFWGMEESYVAYTTAQMNSPVISANPNLFEHFDRMTRKVLEKQNNDKKISYKVKQLIIEILKGDVPTLDLVAQQLTFSKRNLQTKLKQEGQSFQNLLNEVRKELAQQYLKEKQVSKSEIAYLLGFSEVAVFSRNFKKWTGITPTEYQLSA